MISKYEESFQISFARGTSGSKKAGKTEEREEKRKSTSTLAKKKKREERTLTREEQKKNLSLDSGLSRLSSLSSFFLLGFFPFGIVFFPTQTHTFFSNSALYLHLLYLSFEKQQARALLSLSLKGGTNSTRIRKEQRAVVKEWRTTRRFNSSRTTSS